MSQSIKSNKEIKIIVILFLSAIVLHITSFVRYPLPDCDEGWYASTSFNFMHNGSFGMPIINNLLHVGDSYSAFGRFFLLMQAGIFKLLGTGYWQARLLSIIGIMVTALMAYYAGKALYNARVGILTSLLTIWAWDTFSRGHIARPEIWLIAAYLAILTLFWRTREHLTWKSGLWFGFTATLPINFHPNGILFLLGFGVICLVEFGIKKHQWIELMATGVGALIGGLLWFALHFLPDIAISYRQWSAFDNSPIGLTPISLVKGFFGWLHDYHWAAYGYLAAIQTIYFLIAVGLAVRYPDPAHQTLLMLIGISLLAFVFLKSGKQGITSIMWIPFFILLLAASTDQLAHQLYEKLTLPVTPSWLHLILLLPLLIVYMGGDAWLVYKFRNFDYAQTIAQIEQDIPKGAHVTAEGLWWLGIAPNGHSFLEDYYFYQTYQIRDTPPTPADIEALNLDVVILDDGLSCAGFTGPSYDVYQEYVTDHCQPVAQFDAVTYIGNQENTIYQCRGANLP